MISRRGDVSDHLALLFPEMGLMDTRLVVSQKSCY
jgi:hypothetical protein